MFVIISASGWQHILLCKNLMCFIWSGHKSGLYFFLKDINNCSTVPWAILAYTDEREIYKDFFSLASKLAYSISEYVMVEIGEILTKEEDSREILCDSAQHWRKVSFSWSRRLMFMIFFHTKISTDAAELDFWKKQLYELLLSNIYEFYYSQICY